MAPKTGTMGTRTRLQSEEEPRTVGVLTPEYHKITVCQKDGPVQMLPKPVRNKLQS